VAPPGDDLVGANERQRLLVQRAKCPAFQADQRQVNPVVGSRGRESGRVGHAGAEREQRPLAAEQVEERTPVGQPGMGRSPAGQAVGT